MATRSVGTAMLSLLVVSAAFHAYVALTEWTDFAWGVGMLVWAMVPFLAAALVTFISRRTSLGVIPGITALVLDVWLVYSVHTSTSSTAVIAYLWMPLWNLILVVLLGGGGMFILGRIGNARSRAT